MPIIDLPEDGRIKRASQYQEEDLKTSPSGGWYVKSQVRRNVWYWTDGQTRCTCKDWEIHPTVQCKHMLAVQWYIKQEQAAKTFDQ